MTSDQMASRQFVRGPAICMSPVKDDDLLLQVVFEHVERSGSVKILLFFFIPAQFNLNMEVNYVIIGNEKQS